MKALRPRTAKSESGRGLATRVGRQKQKVGKGKQAPPLIDGLDDTAWGRASVHATASCGDNLEYKIKAFLAGGILALGLFGVAMAGQLEDGHELPITAPTSVGKGETAVPMVTHGGTFNVPATINGQLTLKFVVDSGAADVSIPVDVVMTLLRTGTITDGDFLDKQTYQLADGSTVPSRRFVIRTLKIGDKTVENVIGSIAPVAGSLLLGQSFLGRFQSWSIDNERRALILIGNPIEPPTLQSPRPTAAPKGNPLGAVPAGRAPETESGSPTVPSPSAGRAAMLIASADNPQKPAVSLGTTVWSLIPAAANQPATVGVTAEADIPDLKMHATMTVRKNGDPTLQATHTIDLKFSFANGAPITGFKDVGLPQMRNKNSTAVEALTSVKVKISDTHFLIALAKGEADAARNLDLMKTRSWFDFPLLLNDDRIAKVVFQKSPKGQAMLKKALRALE